MTSFAALGAVQETKHARAATAASLKRRVAALIATGALPPSAAAAAAAALDAVPTTRVVTRPLAERTYKHVPGTYVPKALATDSLLLGTRVSLGRARWTHDGGAHASIFSVADGKRLAAEPARHATAWEAARAARVARAAVETPVVAGMRLMPTYTPGRALLWGSVLAAWGTGALAASAARSFGIREPADVGPALEPHLAPLAAAVAAVLEPWRGVLSVSADGGGEGGEAARELGRRVKGRLAAAGRG
jgi:hypothetical protein